jgi:GH15 family glucan-1,4-alpha-glucosidase
MLPAHLAETWQGVFVRQASALHGSRNVRLTCWPGFDYARMPHQASLSHHGTVVVFDAGSAGRLRLSSSHTVRLSERERGPEAVIDTTLEPGEKVTVILDWMPSSETVGPGPAIDRVEEWTGATEQFWHSWIDRSTYSGRWGDAVARSALCLKLLQDRSTGGIVAAPTFGLPEWPGAERNWDYRYVWLRDAAFVNFALLRIGLVDEAVLFASWLARCCAESPTGAGLHPVYRLDGSPPQREEVLASLFHAHTPTA